ncbi:hypothetical protein NECAME_14169 [Necator americanus]|uniref:Receptor ligand binding region domain-containing protein n=1 Tax=Necator americanus TaxID=51031 RepID=W2SS64_NECAM|nr:hypothetical protein NECAME_14169 [Necator americanus]ETN71547.1 hypothetical protein NECAME_14169 [Necator americanus]
MKLLVPSFRSANRFQLTDKVVCEQVINRSIAVVIYAPSLNRETQSEYLSRVSSTAYAVGFYSIPTIGVMVREAEFSKKKIYPTFVRPTPSYADESFVFLNLLRRLDYRQVVVVNVKGDRNGEQFVELFEKKRKKYKIHVQSYIELEINGSLNSSLAASFEEFTSNIVALYATIFYLLHIFLEANFVFLHYASFLVAEVALQVGFVHPLHAWSEWMPKSVTSVNW